MVPAMLKILPVPVNSVVEVRRALLLMIAGSLMIPALDAVAKVLGDFHGLSASGIALGRFGFQTVMLLPLLIAVEGPAALRIRHLGLNLLRGALLGLASYAFFTALKFMPLADTTAIFFVEPILVTLLSALVLGERIGRTRILAVIAGFVGALIVIRPNFVSLGLVAGLPLLTAACIAVYSILNRRLSAGSTPLAMHFYAGVGGTLVLLPIVLGGSLGAPDLLSTIPRSGVVWGLLVAVGALATVGHFFFIKAYHLAPASVLAPFAYVEIISATILGLAIFGDFPAPMDWLGIAVIVGSGIYVFLHEQGAGRERDVPAGAAAVSRAAPRGSAGGPP